MAEYAKTVQELINLVLTELRSQTGTSATIYSDSLEYFNLALQDILLFRAWKWSRKDTTKVTVNGTRKITLGEDTLQVRSIEYTAEGENFSLDELGEDEARRLYPDPTTKGKPRGYISGQYDTTDTSKPPIYTIDLLPTPDAVYTLNISYTASIKKYTSSPDNTTEVPPVPQYVYPALLELFKGYMISFAKGPSRQSTDTRALGYSLLAQAVQFDIGKNKAPGAILLPFGVKQYRVDRYSA